MRKYFAGRADAFGYIQRYLGLDPHDRQPLSEFLAVHGCERASVDVTDLRWEKTISYGEALSQLEQRLFAEFWYLPDDAYQRLLVETARWMNEQPQGRDTVEVMAPSKPMLLWVWVYLLSPRPDGLADNREFDALATIEDRLAKTLGSAFHAVESGRITGDGRREFYFYGADSINFDASVASVMKDFLQYRYRSGNKEDPQWTQYLNVLYPSEESFRRIKNRDVLVALMNRGDTLEAVRDVHHWIYFRTLAQRQSYALKVKELGYRIEVESEHQGRSHPFSLHITRDQSVTPPEIDTAVIELYRLAKQVDADYDGWEAKVVSSPKK